MINFIISHKDLLLAMAWLTSELLAEIPAFGANSVFQLVRLPLQKAWVAYVSKPAAPAPEAPKA